MVEIPAIKMVTLGMVTVVLGSLHALEDTLVDWL
jgi:hypothetical protein